MKLEVTDYLLIIQIICSIIIIFMLGLGTMHVKTNFTTSPDCQRIRQPCKKNRIIGLSENGKPIRADVKGRCLYFGSEIGYGQDLKCMTSPIYGPYSRSYEETQT
jgi:hypothetical protein